MALNYGRSTFSGRKRNAPRAGLPGSTATSAAGGVRLLAPQQHSARTVRTSCGNRLAVYNSSAVILLATVVLASRSLSDTHAQLPASNPICVRVRASVAATSPRLKSEAARGEALECSFLTKVVSVRLKGSDWKAMRAR